MDPLLIELSKFGIGGIIGALLFWLFWQERSGLQACWNARLEERAEALKAVEDIGRHTALALQELTTAGEARSKASEAVARAQEAVTLETTRLRDIVIEMQREQRDINTELLRRFGPRQ